MLKKKAIRKIVITSFSILTIFVICMMPNELGNNAIFLNPSIETTYVNNTETSEIYLLGPNNYLVKTNILLNENDIEDKIKKIVGYLTIDKNSKIPNGLNAIIPSNTKLNSIVILEKIAILDFDEELLNVDDKLEEKVIEALIYSIVNIDGIEGIQIKINGNDLNYLPKTHKFIPQVLNRNFGINKVVEIDNIHDVSKVLMYYIDSVDNNNYYVPVTKYLNDSREKIKIIIDNLASNYIYETNLMSFLNPNTNLINYEIEDKTMKLNFNEGIFSNNGILEEVIYPISESVFENYNLIDSVVFEVNNEEFTRVNR